MPSGDLRPVEVVQAVLSALNRGDIDAALAHCAEDIVLWAPGPEVGGQEIRGKQQLRSILELSETAWPEMWSTVRSIVAHGDAVAVEMVSVAGQGGAQIAQPMAAFFVLRGGMIIEQRNYYDLGSLERSLERLADLDR